MADISEWKDRIENSPTLMLDAIEWMSDDEKERNIASNNRIDSVILLTLCKAQLINYLPTSEPVEGLEDLFDSVISEYAEYRSRQDENDLIEKSCNERMCM